ncbi:MAG: FAD-dependent oxidoreductase [Rhodospirillum sp.]|nr:FAD-dependent oxidoreductase [Rhodospirillum sp.]MCF8488267.1 FAD-dependent oxidoreductase [Rhodospirillum sp.]MCF8500077.1 FAD-dependent oxidoreductase [Rhodospirillum sp.]
MSAPTEDPGVVIVGAGQAGYQVAEALRQDGYEGAITLIGDEPEVPYQRPPLSKAYLLGETDRLRLKFRTEEYYAEHAIVTHLHVSAVSIDRTARTVTLSDGTVKPYGALVLATGARARPLPVPGADLAGVHMLRTLKDIDRIQADMATTEDTVVIGAGFIGLEFAAVARKLGKAVTVVEAAPRVMGRVVSPTLSAYFTQVHEGHGATILCGAQVSALTGEGSHVTGVTLADGQTIPAGLVVVGIGVIPNEDLAKAAGLACDNGIVVDIQGRTEDPFIYAAGDVALHEHPFAGKKLRLESVQNAADQGRSVAAAIAGIDRPHDAVPWFWSDQYDIKLQMTGLREEGDQEVLRGEMDSGKFSLFHFRDGVLRAVDSVNKPADHIQARKLLASGISPTPEQAGDVGFKLKDLLG